ncbi:hypothetical protein Rhe02_52250 [Rhizocola hellebori]|uniref:Uncharacterized protein n=1 Tax=Rhizocola hellebori TaxID=1392758 RepID=A0A8J3QAE3_9ACTN|nr:hypothetical protein Rhe02_52250 [Rhizocola hellebori]
MLKLLVMMALCLRVIVGPATAFGVMFRLLGERMPSAVAGMLDLRERERDSYSGSRSRS